MLAEYFPIIVFLVLGALFGVIPIALGTLLGPKRPTHSKLSPYECGFPPFESARTQFDLRFYLVAILFIIFDLEIVFLFPWAVTLNKISGLGFASMGLFLLLLAIGFIYEWQKGALEWE